MRLVKWAPVSCLAALLTAAVIPKVAIADGGDPQPKPPSLIADGGDSQPEPPCFIADGGDPQPKPPLL